VYEPTRAVMKRFSYRYQTVDCFDAAISYHHFKLRCVPCECGFQHLIEQHLHISPCNNMECDTDAFGNDIQYGGQMEPHNYFSFVSRGVVEQQPYVIHQPLKPSPLFLLPSSLTGADAAMIRFVKNIASYGAADMPMSLCHAVHRWMSYETGSTSVLTTAAEAFCKGVGVCQDYAHVLISLCREAGIPARYVVGFLLGSGETHAWVEVYNYGLWRALDPTNDCQVEYGYVKVAHGRDANDCPVNRGVFTGNTRPHTSIMVNVEEV
jgi:transglutaminase-like putative cysteine protease